MIRYDGMPNIPNIIYDEEINVYLDDVRKCPNDFILARDKWVCANLLDNNKVNVLSLDHDLGEHIYGTGYDVAMHIVEQQEIYHKDIWPKEIYIHSDNPVGRKNMLQLLQHYAPKNVKIHPYAYVI